MEEAIPGGDDVPTSTPSGESSQRRRSDAGMGDLPIANPIERTPIERNLSSAIGTPNGKRLHSQQDLLRQHRRQLRRVHSDTHMRAPQHRLSLSTTTGVGDFDDEGASDVWRSESEGSYSRKSSFHRVTSPPQLRRLASISSSSAEEVRRKPSLVPDLLKARLDEEFGVATPESPSSRADGTSTRQSSFIVRLPQQPPEADTRPSEEKTPPKPHTIAPVSKLATTLILYQETPFQSLLLTLLHLKRLTLLALVGIAISVLWAYMHSVIDYDNWKTVLSAGASINWGSFLSNAVVVCCMVCLYPTLLAIMLFGTRKAPVPKSVMASAVLFVVVYEFFTLLVATLAAPPQWILYVMEMAEYFALIVVLFWTARKSAAIADSNIYFRAIFFPSVVLVVFLEAQRWIVLAYQMFGSTMLRRILFLAVFYDAYVQILTLLLRGIARRYKLQQSPNAKIPPAHFLLMGFRMAACLTGRLLIAGLSSFQEAVYITVVGAAGSLIIQTTFIHVDLTVYRWVKMFRLYTGSHVDIRGRWARIWSEVSKRTAEYFQERNNAAVSVGVLNQSFVIDVTSIVVAPVILFFYRHKSAFFSLPPPQATAWDATRIALVQMGCACAVSTIAVFVGIRRQLPIVDTWDDRRVAVKMVVGSSIVWTMISIKFFSVVEVSR